MNMEETSSSLPEQIINVFVSMFLAIASVFGSFGPSAKPAYELTLRINGPKIVETSKVLQQRIDSASINGLSMTSDGSGTVRVLAPREADLAALKSLLLQKGNLELALAFPVSENVPVPDDARLLKERDNGLTVPVQSVEGLSGGIIQSASVGFDAQFGQPIVNFTFTPDAGKRFGEITSANVGRTFAIVLDDEILSMPRIISPILGGSGQISGNFTTESATALALVLTTGPLPEPVEFVEEKQLRP
jgi:SecD/SecF fusion protein